MGDTGGAQASPGFITLTLHLPQSPFPPQWFFRSAPNARAASITVIPELKVPRNPEGSKTTVHVRDNEARFIISDDHVLLISPRVFCWEGIH